MKISLIKRSLVLMLAAMLLAPASLLADDKKEATAPATAVPKGKLADDENPLLIGNRKINKHQINFYSLEKEVGIGRQLSAEVDRQAKFVDDPIITEYINRVGQNIVLHSDAKVPFTIKVLDSDDVNAFALPGGFFYVNKGLDTGRRQRGRGRRRYGARDSARRGAPRRRAGFESADS